MKYLRYILVMGLLWGISCANPIPPTGGPNDEAGPLLLTEMSTPNYQTNFTPTVITMTFDEWVKLEDPNNQILISPPLKFNPEFKKRGKEVEVIFNEEEELRPNTTYTIQFGESIQDITEDNPSDQLKYVFSTGPVLDSLKYKGIVRSIDRKTPVADVMVMLYSTHSDSMPYLEKPAYTAKTNEAGQFVIENLPSDTFKVFALLDQNRNYVFEPAQEALAFDPELVIITDSTPSSELILFQETPPFQITQRTLGFHKLAIVYNQKPDTNFIDFQSQSFSLSEWGQDSAQLWLERPTDSVTFMTLPPLAKRDTFIIKRKRKIKKDTTSITMNKAAMSKAVLSSKDSLFIHFSRPIISFDSSQWMATDSGGIKIDLQFNQISPRVLSIQGTWPITQELKLEILPGGVNGITGQINKDTLVHNIFIPAVEKLGTLILEAENIDSSTQHVVQLLTKEQVIRSFIVERGVLQKTKTFTHLRPGKYEVVIIKDENLDGKWTTGNYLQGRQPEIKWKQELEPLRENWDLKVDLKL